MNDSSSRPTWVPRPPSLVTRIVNGLVSLTWIGLALAFSRTANPLGRSGPLPFSIWLVLGVLVLLALLISDVRLALRKRGNADALLHWGDALLWVGFLLAILYWQVDVLATPLFGSIVCLVVAVSFALKALPKQPLGERKEK